MWLRVDDHYSTHRAVAPLSDAALRMHVNLQVHCAAQLTGGHVATGIPASMPQAPRGAALRRVLTELESGLLLDPTDGGWALLVPEGPHLVPFTKLNPAKAAAPAELSDKRRAAGQRGAEARWQSHGKPDGKSDGKSDGKTEAKAMASAKQTDAPVSDPDPQSASDPLETSSSKDLPSVTRLAAPAIPEQKQELDYTDSESMTLCPVDLVERAERLGVFGDIAGALKVDLDALRAEAEQYVAHFVIGGGIGEKGNRWMKRLRGQLVRKARASELAAPGLLDHAARKGLEPAVLERPERRVFVPKPIVDAAPIGTAGEATARLLASFGGQRS